MATYNATLEIIRLFDSPIKLCSITLNNDDLKKIGAFFSHPVSEFAGDKTGQITLDLKIKRNTLYFTEQSQSNSVNDLIFSLKSAYIYKMIVDKGLNDPSAILFQGSLRLADIIKLFEVTGRHLRHNLCDEQFKAIYREMIDIGNRPLLDVNFFENSNVYVKWLSNVLNDYTSYEQITKMEVSVLEREGLLNESLVQKQSQFIKDKNFHYYLVEENADYLKEIVVASKRKRMDRSPVYLLRDEITDQPIGSRKEASVFSELFDEKDENLTINF